MAEFRVLISAGELSGDEHGARVIQSLQSLIPSLACRGMGGRHLRGAGVDTVVDSEASAGVMGFVEVLGSLGRIYGAYQKLKELLHAWRPHLVITVDYAEFNMRLLGAAHGLGIKTLSFIPPQVWAWRRYRAHTVARIADRTCVIFPFEKAFFEGVGYNGVRYVGHPLVATRPEPFDRRDFLTSLSLSSEAPSIALMPGSRRAELERHLGPSFEALKILKLQNPALQAVLVAAATTAEDAIRPPTEMQSWVKITRESALRVLPCLDGGLIKSGTSNLHAAFSGLPFCMFYKTSPLSAFLARTFVGISQYSIVNVIRPDTVTEVIQEEVTPERLAGEVSRLLFQAEQRDAVRRDLHEVVASLEGFDPRPEYLGTQNSYERVAKTAEELLKL